VGILSTFLVPDAENDRQRIRLFRRRRNSATDLYAELEVADRTTEAGCHVETLWRLPVTTRPRLATG
jgi:hypothetical protein